MYAPPDRNRRKKKGRSFIPFKCTYVHVCVCVCTERDRKRERKRPRSEKDKYGRDRSGKQSSLVMAMTGDEEDERWRDSKYTARPWEDQIQERSFPPCHSGGEKIHPQTVLSTFLSGFCHSPVPDLPLCPLYLPICLPLQTPTQADGCYVCTQA